jgi:hypothetical protein
MIQAAARLIVISLRTVSPKSAKPEEKLSLGELRQAAWSHSTRLPLVIAF